MPGAPFLAQAADGKLRPFNKQNIYVYHKWQLSMRKCTLRSDAPSNTLPVLPLRVVSQGNFIIARCKSILCTRSFPMGDGGVSGRAFHRPDRESRLYEMLLPEVRLCRSAP